MTQALYRKYRPRGWDEVIGQGHVVQTLRNAIVSDRVGHAYLFAGRLPQPPVWRPSEDVC